MEEQKYCVAIQKVIIKLSNIQNFNKYNQPTIYGIYCKNNYERHRAYTILRKQVPDDNMLLDEIPGKYFYTPATKCYFFNLYADNMNQPVNQIWIQENAPRQIYQSSIIPNLLESSITVYKWLNSCVQTFCFEGDQMIITGWQQEDTERMLLDE